MTGPGLLRVVTWNVHGLLGDPLAVHRVLRALGGDVVCLQEAPRRPGSRWRLAALARAGGLYVAAGGREAAGNAVLLSLRTQADEVRAFRLPTPRFGQPRGAVLLRVRPPGGDWMAVAAVHLGLDPVERVAHAVTLAGLLRGTGLPAVVAGDLNEHPGDDAWQAFGDVAADPLATGDGAPTFPARDPQWRIDAVLTGARVDVADYRVEAGDDVDPADLLAASDHLPVIADVGIARS